MKYPVLAVALMFVAIAAAACGGIGGAGNTPEDSVKAWFDAAFAGNTEGVEAQTCAAAQGMIGELTAAFGADGNPVDASGLIYSTASVDATTAVVSINGSAKKTVEGQEIEVPLDGAILPLVLENGSWKVCRM